MWDSGNAKLNQMIAIKIKLKIKKRILVITKNVEKPLLIYHINAHDYNSAVELLLIRN